MQDVILRVTKSEFSRTILCLSSRSGIYIPQQVKSGILSPFYTYVLHKKTISYKKTIPENNMQQIYSDYQ